MSDFSPVSLNPRSGKWGDTVNTYLLSGGEP